MIDFDEHMNALRELVNESAIIVGGGPHGVYELSEHDPGMSVMLCSFAEYNAERFKKDRG
jgi:3-phosphoglycerate kinase